LTEVRSDAGTSGVGSCRHTANTARRHDLVRVSKDVADHEVWLITHPEFRRDPKVRAAADFLKRRASEPDGLR
jgi:DNA-binding transcriptional LysR family regulator